MIQVVIVGGGFAGLRLARKLKNKKNIVVTLVNDSPEFRYCPAMYRSATGYKLGLSSISLEWALLDITNVNLVIGKVTGLNSDKKEVLLEDGTKIPYNYVVMAMGSVTTFFNIEGLHEHAFGVKSVEEIISLRKHLHDKLLDKDNPETNFVIAGAGPTGIEIAGGLGSYLKRISREHRHKRHKITIWLVEAGPRIMPQMSERASKIIAKKLDRAGVKILTSTRVEAETIRTLKTSEGNIKTHTVIWTAGTLNNPFFKENNQFKLNERGKVIVNSHLEALEHVYVIGDNVATPYSGLALTAIKHSNFVAKDIQARVHHKKRPVKYESMPVQIVPTGKNWAILKYGWILLYGRPISWLRKVADYVGYSDVLGFSKASTIWSNSETEEDKCVICMPGK